MFSQSLYSVDEDTGVTQPVLVLTNPASTDITVEVFSTYGTAIGEYRSILIYYYYYNGFNNCYKRRL